MNRQWMWRMLAVTTLGWWPAGANAQWDVFTDPDVESQCSVVNTASLEFAVRVCDGALVLVTGPDEGYANTFVTLDGTVQIDGVPSGFVAYDVDGDGFYTLWWLSEDGYVIDFDDVAVQPFETDFLPSDFGDVPCDTAEFWEGDGDCGADFGGVIMEPLERLEPDGGGNGGGNGGSGGGITTCGGLSTGMLLAGLLGLTLVSWRRHG